MNKKQTIGKALLFVLLAYASCQTLEAQKIPLTEENWKIIDNENSQILDFHTTSYKGKEALRLGRHEIAKLEGKTYHNFVLEMDIAGKAMPGIGFRSTDLFNYEFFYCRVFSGGKEDALQYAPVYNGALPWQLYNMPIYETRATFKSEEWFHLKMEVYENQMRVFIGDDNLPEMQVELIRGTQGQGAVFLKTSFAEAYFANLEIQELEASFTIPNTNDPTTYLSNWEISEQVEGNIYSQRQYYQRLENAQKNHEWKKN